MNITACIKYFFLIGLGVNITSCLPSIKDCDSRELKDAFASDRAQFKKEVIRSMPSYVLLKNFIINNLPAILNHNNEKSFVITQHKDGTKDTIKSVKNYYTLYNYGKGNEIKDQVPTQLYPQLQAIYKNFDNENFYSVSFQRDSTVTISITNPSEYNDKNIGINHKLVWENRNHSIFKDKSSMIRDTVLNGAVFTAFIDCYRGI